MLCAVKGKFYVWTRWGRVGEVGQSKLDGGMGEDKAVAGFEAKFRSKTQNAWDERDSFKPHAGKYDLVDVDEVRRALRLAPLLRPARRRARVGRVPREAASGRMRMRNAVEARAVHAVCCDCLGTGHTTPSPPQGQDSLLCISSAGVGALRAARAEQVVVWGCRRQTTRRRWW